MLTLVGNPIATSSKHCCVCWQWVCKHVKAAIKAARLGWYEFLKPWQKTDAWQRAVGDAWDQLDYEEIAAATRRLARDGQLLRLKEAELAINRKGAPSGKDVDDMEGRAKSFLEELGADALAEEETKRVMSGASGPNPISQHIQHYNA